MEVTKALFFIVAGFLVVVVAVMVFTGGTERGRVHFPSGPTIVRLLALPEIDKISPDSCKSTSFEDAFCSYKLRIKGLRAFSNYTDDVAVVVSYKGQEWLVPCGLGDARKGPCRFDGETSFDLELDVAGAMYDAGPPTLNMSAVDSFRGWAFEGQTIILDNYAVSLFKVFSVSLLLTIVEPKAIVTAECNREAQFGRESKRATLAKGEEAVLGLCGSPVYVRVADIRRDEKQACLELGVAGGPEWNGPGDKITVSFWALTPEFRGEQDLRPCGGLSRAFPGKVKYVDKFRWSTEAALKDPKCVEAFLGSIDLSAEVLPYNPSASPWKVEQC